MNIRHSTTRLGSLLFISGGVGCEGKMNSEAWVVDLTTRQAHCLTTERPRRHPEMDEEMDEEDKRIQRNSNQDQTIENTDCSLCGTLKNIPPFLTGLRSHQNVTITPSENLGLSSSVIVAVGGWMSIKNMMQVSTRDVVPQWIEKSDESETLKSYHLYSFGLTNCITLLRYESPNKKVFFFFSLFLSLSLFLFFSLFPSFSLFFSLFLSLSFSHLLPATHRFSFRR